MPVYDFKCSAHGLFHELVPIGQSGEAFPCPQCGASCAPVILVAPLNIGTSNETRKAIESNEEAQHNPIISTTDSRNEAEEKRKFEASRKGAGSACGCSEHRSDRSALKQQVVFLPDGSKVFPSQRPWMISH